MPVYSTRKMLVVGLSHNMDEKIWSLCSTNVNSNTKENEAAGFIAKFSKVESG